MKMPLTYVQLQRHNVFPVKLDLDQSVPGVYDQAAETVAQWVPQRHCVSNHPFDRG